MDEHMADVKAHQLMSLDSMKDGWSAPTLAIFLRHECKCVYCSCDLLQSRDMAYYWYCMDHLLPKGKYPDPRGTLENRPMRDTSKPANGR